MGVVDLDSVVRQWVEKWHHIDEDDTLDIDWKKVRFSTASSNANPVQQQQQRRTRRPGSGVNGAQRSQAVFSSHYTNSTTEVQNHTFRMERQTDAIVKTKLTKGFARNGTVGIKIDIPEPISNATSSFGHDVEISHQDENIVKHSVTWSLDSNVRVRPRSCTTAEMRITETQYEYTFNAEVSIRGRVIVHLSDGRTVEGNIAQILSDGIEDGTFNSAGVNVQERKVTWSVSGTLHFKFGVSQDVTVSSEDL